MGDRNLFPFNIEDKLQEGEQTPAWQTNEDFRDLYSEYYDVTMLSPYRAWFVYQFTRMANTLPGQMAVVGCYNGGSAKFMHDPMDKSKTLYLFDTFEGLPTHHPKYDFFPAGVFDEARPETVEKVLGEPQNWEIIKGRFPQSVQDSKMPSTFSYVYLDVDQYNANYESLQYFYNRMTPGGIILIDDYGWEYAPGIRKSVEDFFSEGNRPESPLITTRFQGALIKLS